MSATPNTRAGSPKKRIMILGGGFAGAYAAQHLEKLFKRSTDVEIVIVSKENFVLFTPMLHEVAGADVSVTDIVQPLRKMLRHVRILIMEILAIDLEKRNVRLRHETTGFTFDMAYDQLVLAIGAVTNFYHNETLEKNALTMKTLGDAIVVRNRAIDVLEIADNVKHESIRGAALTIIVAGGGFAGVETAGAVNDLMRESIRYYPNLKADMVKVVIIHGGDVLLPELTESLGRFAERKMQRRGIEVRLNTRVESYDGHDVVLGDGTKITGHTLIWTAGITPSPILSTLPCKLDRGRVLADSTMQVPNWPGVWALGDCAHVPDSANPGKYYPPTAQHAIRMAAVLAKNIAASMAGKPLTPFKFKTLGLLATIGRRTGVAEILGLRFSGFFAWWLWRGIYLSKLPGFQKKVRVAIDWTLDMFFSKDLVQVPTVRSPTMQAVETDKLPTTVR